MVAEKTLAYRHLHELLQQLEDAERMLAHGPRRIKTARKKVDELSANVVQQKEHIQQLRKKADEASLNLKTKEAEVVKHAGRLNEAASNKEYEIIQGQIDSIRKTSEAMEDEILAMLTEVDEESQALKDLEQEVSDAEARTKEIEADVKSKEPGLNADVARLNEEIAVAEKSVTGGEAMATYKRLRLASGADAFAKVMDGYCEECNTQATPQDNIRLNMGEFLLCRQCGRILYTVGSSSDED